MRYALLLTCCFLLSNCGDGNFKINSDNGSPSNISLKGTPTKNIDSEEAKTFFEENIWDIMKETSGAGCAASGCHELTDDPNTFFTIDVDSAENTWNWAKVRRFELTESDYLDLGAAQTPQLISGQKDINHFNFINWTDEQKALIDEWVEIE